jgi:hypothetical protein
MHFLRLPTPQAALDGFKGEADAREQRLMAAAEAKFARLQFDTSAEITRLAAENAACKQQLADVRFFREDKENVEQGVRDLKAQLAAQAAEARVQMRQS